MGDFTKIGATRYKMSSAKNYDMVKLKMKFPKMNETCDLQVIEREGKIIGLAEVETMVYIHNVHLVKEEENSFLGMRTMIALIKIIKDAADKSGSGVAGFIHKSKSNFQIIVEKFGAHKERHSSGRMYLYNG